MNFIRSSVLGRSLSPLALLAGAAILSAGIATPAAAQKKKAEKAAPAAKANYSKEFVAAYKPVETQMNTAGTDFATLKPMVPGLVAVAKTPDDQLAAGRVIFQIGQKTNDYSLSLQGAELMVNSGRADPKLKSQLQFAAGQLAYNLKDYAKARSYTQQAIDGGYTDNDPPLFLAETYFADAKYAEGLKYLSDLIAARKAAGQPVSESWVKKALATAYTNNLHADARRWGLVYARDFPSASSWGDAIAIAINTGDFASPEMLDLLRLAKRTGTLRTKAMYLEYVDAADARKLPNEVNQVLDAGVAAKLIDPSIQLVKDARAVTTARLAADKAELPALQRDANAGAAKLVTVMAAADTLLSYGKSAEAEALYTKALGMAGVNKDLAMTRMGIAQIDQGKFADAQATLAKVGGMRQPIAALWALYAAQKAVPAPIPAPAATS